MIGSAWSSNTLLTRNSQWSRFIKFCNEHGLQVMPASANTVCRFLIWQSRTSKYSTCNNYLSAINVLHRFYGHDIDFRQFFVVKLVLKGLKSTLGDKVTQKIPLLKLLKMYEQLDLSVELEQILWTIIIVSFRTLLRKSNLVPTLVGDLRHVVLRRDVDRYEWGILLRVGSTKTLQNNEYSLELPVHFVECAPLCAASAIIHHIDKFPAPPDSPLFVEVGKKPIIYAELLGFLKDLSSRIGIDPGLVGCHSLRRSGTAYMHSIGVPLEDIMSIGDWRSLSVLDYLVTPRSRKDQIQRAVASSLNF